LKLNPQYVLAFALFLGPPAFGQQISVDFDPIATKIKWSLAGNVHTTHGTFPLKEGHVSVDSSTGKASGQLLVEAETGQSGNTSRDKRMKKEILETDKYPEIRFTVTKVAGSVSATASKVRVAGQFIIHGASHEIDVPLTVSIQGAEFNGTGKFVVPYVAWGIKDPSNFLFKVDKTVEVELVVVGHVPR
jgi:polyisoprenoid-binding protein YceI